jgi:hypothetical protein
LPARAGLLATNQEEDAMPARSIVSRFSRTAVAGALALAFPLAGLAGERTSGATLTITLFADRYMAAGVPFADLDRLDALVQPMNSSVLQLEGCGPESAGALLAAAERYRGAYLEIRMLTEGERGCNATPAEGAVRVSQIGSAVSPRRPDVPTDRYWQSVIP